MKTKFIFTTIIIVFLSVGVAYTQITPSIQKISLTGSDKTILDQRISKYSAFTIDNKELVNNLNSNGGGQFRLRIDENLDWTIELELNDLRADDYKATYTSDKGTFEIKEHSVVNTFKGKTSDGHVTRFTIDENYFFGVILGENYHYVIRPSKDYTQNKQDKNFIVYHSWDIIPDDEHFDYINDALENPEKTINHSETNSSTNTISSRSCSGNYLKIATEADYEFHRATVLNNDIYTLIENVTNVRILSILNIIEGVYESTFGLKFLVSFQHVYTSPAQPYTSSDAETLRDSFRSHWNANHTSVKRNIAHLFTGKSITFVDTWTGYLIPVWGISYVGNYINGNDADNYAYSVSMNRTEMYQTTAHEIGHNFSAQHPSESNCLCGGITASVMCQGEKNPSLWFCYQSKSVINNTINNNLGLLVGICGSTPLCSGTWKTFTASSWQSGYYWDKSAGISFSGSTTSSSIGVSAASSGNSWLGYVCIKNSIGVELARYRVWYGEPAISVYAPYDVVPQTGYEAILSYNGAPYTLQGVTSVNWTCTSNLKIMSKSITGAGFIVTKMSGTGTESATITAQANNSCGSTSTYQSLTINWPSPSPSPSPFTIYPNPTIGALNIEIDQQSVVQKYTLNQTYTNSKIDPTFDVRLYDGLGNLLRQILTKGGTVQFNVSNLLDGLYYLHIYDGISSKPEMQQIVVEH